MMCKENNEHEYFRIYKEAAVAAQLKPLSLFTPAGPGEGHRGLRIFQKCTSLIQAEHDGHACSPAGNCKTPELTHNAKPCSDIIQHRWVRHAVRTDETSEKS
jgi:hypothetical protein